MASTRTYRCKALVLDKTKLKEQDLILTLLSENGAQIRAVAKGARKPGSRLAARCELFCTVDLLLAKGKNLDIVSQAELEEAPLGTFPDYDRLKAASAIAEVARYCCYEDAQDPFTFAITRAALAHCGDEAPAQEQCDLLVAAYVFKMLSHIGYRPDFSSCVYCGDHALSYFSASAGGLLCASCAKSVPGSEPIDERLANWLSSLIALTFDQLLSAPIDLQTSNRLLALAHQWAAVHLDARLRAMEFLLGH